VEGRRVQDVLNSIKVKQEPLVIINVPAPPNKATLIIDRENKLGFVAAAALFL
jgi:hypothetical protein